MMAITLRVSRRWRLVVLFSAAAMLSALAVHGQQPADKFGGTKQKEAAQKQIPDVPVGPADDLDEDVANPPLQRGKIGEIHPVPVAESFAYLVLDGRGPEVVARARLRLQLFLKQRLEFIDRVCSLSEGQRQKLDLAGRGDIVRFFDRVEDGKKKFARFNDGDAGNAIVRLELLRESKPLHEALMAGPFDDGSLFAKSLRNILTTEEAARYGVLREIERLGGRFDAGPKSPAPLKLDDVSEVRLSGTAATDQVAARLVLLSNLRSLFLNGTQVTDAGLADISGLARLEVLDLSGTQISDAGLTCLAKFATLQVLYLVNTEITDAGVARLADLACIKSIYLTGTAISDAGAAKLKAAAPALEIRR
jgi:hypothetical protein